jgi:hypothetical protein
MAVPTSELSPSPTQEPDYRPISGLAVASLIVALLFAGILVLGVVLSALTHAPLPEFVLWFLPLPLAGAALALVATWQIHRSQGTRAGLATAKWGGLLSVFLGVIYLTLLATTEWVIGSEARTFTDQWLRTVAEGKLEHAFVKTMEPDRARNLDPDDPQDMIRFTYPRAGGNPGALFVFKDHELIHLLEQGGPATQIEWLGVSDWRYQGGGCQVKQAYRLKTLGGTFDVVVAVQGNVDARNRRQWFVLIDQSPVQRRDLSPLTQRVNSFSEAPRRFAENWVNKFGRGEILEAYLDTRDPDERDRLRLNMAPRSLLLRLSALGMPPGLAWSAPLAAQSVPADQLQPNQGSSLPGYTAFTEGSLVVADKLQGPGGMPAESVAESVRVLRGAFRPGLSLPSWPEMKLQFVGPRPWKVLDDRLQFEYEVRLSFLLHGAKPTGYTWDGSLVLQSGPGWEKEKQPPAWRIARFTVTRVREGAVVGS